MSIHHDPDRTQRMCALYQRSIPVATIAAQFGVLPPAVHKALRRGGVLPAYQKRDKISPVAVAVKASLAERLANGGSAKQWARETGTSETEARRVWRAICRDLGPQAA